MAIVYLATNLINGKRYIGITERTLSRRRSEHRCHAVSMANQGAFYRAIRKYGAEMFRYSVLLRCDVAVLKQHEIRLIALLQPEYNSTAGGDGRLQGTMSAEGRQRIRDRHVGQQWRLGTTHTPETKERLRRVAKGADNMDRWRVFGALGPKSIQRCVRCLDDGRIYESATNAANAYGVAKSALIELCLGQRGRRTVGGLRFAYVEDGENVAAISWPRKD